MLPAGSETTALGCPIPPNGLKGCTATITGFISAICARADLKWKWKSRSGVRSCACSYAFRRPHHGKKKSLHNRTTRSAKPTVADFASNLTGAADKYTISQLETFNTQPEPEPNKQKSELLTKVEQLT